MSDEIVAGNSNKRRNYQAAQAVNTEDKPQIEPLQHTGKIRKMKKSPGRKLLETFIHDDVKDVKGYVISEVLIPAIKDTFAAIVHGTTDMLLYGETRSRSRSERRDYSSIYYKGNQYSSFDRSERRRENRNSRSSSSVDDTITLDDILFERREEAQDCLDSLMEYIDRYDRPVSVSDFYGMVGVAGQFTDCEYGWDNLNQAQVRRVRDGYIIKFPRPYPINM